MLNPFEPGFFDDPYAQYRLVREQDPVHLSPIGACALFRYDDVHRVLRDPSLSVEERHTRPDRDSRRSRHRGDARRAPRGRHAHHAQPRPARPSPAAPAGVEGVHAAHDRGAPAARRRQLVDEHLDARRTAAPFDLIAGLAFPLPFVVISEMLGIPEGRDRSQLREWSGAVVKTFDPILTREEILAVVRRDRQHQRVRQRGHRVEARAPERRPAQRARSRPRTKATG